MTPEQHFMEYQKFQRWSDGLRWTGITILVLGATLLCTGNPIGCVQSVLAYIPVAIARDICADRADQHLCASCSRVWRDDS